MKTKLFSAIVLLLLADMILSISVSAQDKEHPLNINDRQQIFNAPEDAAGIMATQKNIKPKALTTLIQLYDSIYYWHWDTISNGWSGNPYRKIINIIYDANNNQTSQLGQNWNGSAWANNSQDTYTYDANNNLTSELYQTWNGSAWVNGNQYIYTYDANNNLTSELYQTWNGSIWVNDEQYIYTYDASNNQTSELYQTWNGSIWVNDYQYTYTYDANNNLTSQLGQNWNGSIWVNDNQYTYTYDANNNQTSYLYQSWNGSAWVNYHQVAYTYDANNNRTSFLQQNWNGSAWVNYYQLAYTYDANNFQQNYAYRFWNGTGTAVTIGDSAYYYFHTAVGINNPTATVESITIFPNPTTGTFTLQSTNQQINNSTITISNVLGEKIYSSIINQQKSIINLGAPNGIYFVQLRNNEQTITRKIILSK